MVRLRPRERNPRKNEQSIHRAATAGGSLPPTPLTPTRNGPGLLARRNPTPLRSHLKTPARRRRSSRSSASGPQEMAAEMAPARLRRSGGPSPHHAARPRPAPPPLRDKAAGQPTPPGPLPAGSRVKGPTQKARYTSHPGRLAQPLVLLRKCRLPTLHDYCSSPGSASPLPGSSSSDTRNATVRSGKWRSGGGEPTQRLLSKWLTFEQPRTPPSSGQLWSATLAPHAT